MKKRDRNREKWRVRRNLPAELPFLERIDRRRSHQPAQQDADPTQQRMRVKRLKDADDCNTGRHGELTCNQDLKTMRRLAATD